MGDALSRRHGIDRREFVAPAAGRLDVVLAAACPDLSRARLQRLIAGGHVSVNGAAVQKSFRVAAGDRLSLEAPETEHPAQTAGPGVPILYEDDDLVAVDKPPGLAVHGAPGDSGPSVAAWFTGRYPDDARAFDVERPGIVHRLDKDTSGVLLLARTPQAQTALSRAFEARKTRKAYLAICMGKPEHERAVVDAAIARHPGDRTRMAVTRQGRPARTEYQVLASDGERTLLLVTPESGRTHQIRVHLAAVGIPVANDRVYGRGGEGRQLLHAWQLTVPHPGGGKLTITAPLPADFMDAVRSMGAETIALPYSTPTPPLRTEDSS
ncbi:MAG: RluA family pseudouridine synthase [Chloroflexi bacterium CFX7]|nr:RluA family pseudouridine synthase [Chloroflexi bacterium CFX7]MCK6565287.1 RluA family pseudouridine synthase [Dehalococcoidia bacterium]RIL04196.1 MAG: RluA family pseudouridine synthase [bacterium]